MLPARRGIDSQKGLCDMSDLPKKVVSVSMAAAAGLIAIGEHHELCRSPEVQLFCPVHFPPPVDAPHKDHPTNAPRTIAVVTSSTASFDTGDGFFRIP
jgi:hypothetical protein